MKFWIDLATDYNTDSTFAGGSSILVDSGPASVLDLPDGDLEDLAQAFADVYQSGIPGSGNWTWSTIRVPVADRVIQP
jgi:hypothetical protein